MVLWNNGKLYNIKDNKCYVILSQCQSYWIILNDNSTIELLHNCSICSCNCRRFLAKKKEHVPISLETFLLIKNKKRNYEERKLYDFPFWIIEDGYISLDMNIVNIQACSEYIETVYGWKKLWTIQKYFRIMIPII